MIQCLIIFLENSSSELFSATVWYGLVRPLASLAWHSRRLWSVSGMLDDSWTIFQKSFNGRFYFWLNLLTEVVWAMSLMTFFFTLKITTLSGKLSKRLSAKRMKLEILYFFPFKNWVLFKNCVVSETVSITRTHTDIFPKSFGHSLKLLWSNHVWDIIKDKPRPLGVCPPICLSQTDAHMKTSRKGSLPCIQKGRDKWLKLVGIWPRSSLFRSIWHQNL